MSWEWKDRDGSELRAKAEKKRIKKAYRDLHKLALRKKKDQRRFQKPINQLLN